MVIWMTTSKKLVAGAVITALLVLIFIVGHTWGKEAEKTNHMRAVCMVQEGTFGYGDVGFGFEALCIQNGFPLRWESGDWVFTLPLYEVVD